MPNLFVDIDLERRVLGELMRGADVSVGRIKRLHCGAFSDGNHRLVFLAVQQCQAAAVRLPREELLSRLPDDQPLIDLVGELAVTPRLASLEQAVMVLIEFAATNALIVAIESVARSARIGQDIHALIDELDHSLHAIADGLTGRGASPHVAVAEDELLPF